ncbi:family 78 glycoside hydrolase catalytic domain [Cellulophaga sp. F20128]|uniref:alpha-L-rhamnosidase-related protein n=1 Tax=Cellulophaga sp. F20128 TaxID=2926413 RepID=UPI001FF17B21|nr:alpha-L-rhamnosidase C-terminal domain-containing protein [Cellulophaga sp. F20128]MCK0157280.1 family 78 glycoside hydrolase catalytic domain [Cellulophaga sp. F20128]
MKKQYISIFFFIVMGSLVAQKTIDKIELQTSLITPKKVTKIKEGHYFIDFGRAFFGTVQMQSSVAQTEPLTVQLGEKLKATFAIDDDPGKNIRYQKVTVENLRENQLTTVELVPYERNTTGAAIMLPDSLGTIIPFRYLEIENLKVPIEAIEIQQKAVHYKFNDAASYFSSSSVVMDSIWDMCKHTIKATSFTGYYVDGDRERIPYEADAYINQLSHYSVDSEYTMATRTNDYFIKNPTWPTEWLLHTVLMFYADFMYTGDLGPLQKHYDDLKIKTLMDLEGSDGLISSKSPKLNQELVSKLGFKKANTKIRDIIDWPPAQKDTGWKLATPEGERDGYEIVDTNTAVNSFYYYNLKLMAEIAGYLNKKEDAILFKNKAAITKQAINDKLFDATLGIYTDGIGSSHSSLHANMFPLAFDLVPEEHVKTVTAFVKSRGMACSVYGAQFLLEGLFKNGEALYATELITNTEGDRNWWNMIRVGSTMAMEAWDVKYKPNADWNHAWGTAPLNVITRYMWGITPLTPGFDIAQIKPQLGGLTFSKIKVPTKNGAITAEHKIEDNETTYKIELPENMEAEFVLPDNALKISHNNKKLNKNETTLLLEKGENIIKVIVE